MLVTVYDAKKASLSRGKQIHGRVKGILQICLKTVGHKRVEELSDSRGLAFIT